MNDDEGGARLEWEQRWAGHDAATLQFQLDAVPDDLRQVVAEVADRAGRALDLGCGASPTTAYLAGEFATAVGVDFSHAALLQAARAAGADDAPVLLAVADAAALPFGDATFGLIFDRGCLQNMPRQRWPAYFDEVQRLLAPGGLLQLYCSKQDKAFPPLRSVRGLRARLRWYAGKRGGPQFLTPTLLREEYLPPSLEVRTLEELPMRTNTGGRRTLLRGSFRRR